MQILLSAGSRLELQRRLSALDATVPPRTQGRTTEHVERYAITHLVSSLPVGRLQFPLTVVRRDRPDFQLIAATQVIGVEHTEAVPPNVAHAQALREQGAGPDVYFAPLAEPGEAKKSSAKITQEILADSPSEPWVGDAPEREWAAAMMHAAVCKQRKVQHPTFEKFDENWLLIYDNWPLPAVHHSKAATHLSRLLASTTLMITFDRLFVLNSRFLCEFGQVTDQHLVLSPS
jgi:hypothetical protein